jgi:hypothetical protein
MQITTVDSNGLLTDNILAETTMPASAFTTEDYFSGVGDLELVEFSNPGLLQSGEKYAFIIRLESPSVVYPDPAIPFGTTYLLPYKEYVYPGGDVAVEYAPSCGGSEWFTDTSHDLIFAIYVTPLGPTSKADCKKSGYKDFGFETQGQCIKVVNSSAKQRTN